MNVLRGGEPLILIRSFWDDRPPGDVQHAIHSDAGKFLSDVMCGYAWKLSHIDPRDLPRIWTQSSVHQEGTHHYVGVGVIPKSRAAEISGTSGVTGMPEYDRLSREGPLTEVKDNPVVLTEFPGERLAGNIVLMYEEGRKIKMLYQGKEVPWAFASQLSDELGKGL